MIYTYGWVTQTVYRATKAKLPMGGYTLRVYERGRTRELTSGDFRDYLASVSPDGKSVYFSTTRGVKSDNPSIAFAASVQIARMPLDGSASPEIYVASDGHNTAVAQPVVSPDGRHLVWAQLERFSPDGGWTIYGSRLESPAKRAKLTPPMMTALAPCWHPDGTLIAFTGYMPDDSGWGVWVMDTHTFGLRRLADGENPSFAPDGTWFCYERGGNLYRRTFDAKDRPSPTDTLDAEIRAEAHIPERVVWSTGAAAARQSFGKPGEEFAFGRENPVFLRARIRWNGKEEGAQIYVVCDYEKCSAGVELFVGKGGRLYFSSRNEDGRFRGVYTVLPEAGEYGVVAVRTRDSYVLSVDGGQPVELEALTNFDLKEPKALAVATTLGKGSELLSAQIGTGWPKDMPTSGSLRKEVMK